jgi:apolipoprotein N-acyltransferase
MPSIRRALTDMLLLLLGAFLYTIAAPPYEWSIAGWFALTPLILVAANKSPRLAFLAGLVYGVLFCLGMAYWVYFAVATYFPLGAPLSFLCTVLSYAVFIASYVGLAAAGVAVLFRRPSPMLCGLGVPALWVSAEFARTSLFSGFSWELLGYTQYRNLWLIQIADLTGVYGLSFLMALSGYVAAETIRAIQGANLSPLAPRLPWLAGGCFVLALIMTLGYGVLRTRQYAQDATTAPLTIALVQQNVSSTQRWQRVHYAHVLLQYIGATQKNLGDVKPDLVVWPEFALGFYLDRELSLRAQLGRLTNRLQAPLLVGAPRVEETATGTQYFNSAYLLAPNGVIRDTYDKIRLLPFAEYRPLGILPTLLPHHAEYPTEFTSGTRPTIFSLGHDSAFGVTICYEITYPALTRQLARDGARFFVNISNESWLAQAGPAATTQHFSMSVFRAVENRRPLARVATAGVSGFIDATGHIQEHSSAPESVLIGRVVPQTEQTVYTRYGDWFATLCAAIAAIALIDAVRRHRHMRP